MKDPYMEVLQEIKTFLKNELVNVTKRLDKIEKVLPTKEVYNMKDCAKVLDVSLRYVYDHPEFLPNGGVSEFSGSKKWTSDTFESWRSGLREGKRGKKAVVFT